PPRPDGYAFDHRGRELVSTFTVNIDSSLNATFDDSGAPQTREPVVVNIDNAVQVTPAAERVTETTVATAVARTVDSTASIGAARSTPDNGPAPHRGQDTGNARTRAAAGADENSPVESLNPDDLAAHRFTDGEGDTATTRLQRIKGWFIRMTSTIDNDSAPIERDGFGERMRRISERPAYTRADRHVTVDTNLESED
ncbi:MAG: hypothetical protein KDA21_05620, partial [Phycisphaerales bacterium]|nr:hypothetical protein [Phycisphaerales bacterium]